MTVDVATPDESRMTRARRAFRRWRKSRPFWGGLLLILAGVEIFYSGNLNLGNIQIHLGLNGFKSYIIPLVVVLCGALIWATPAQRIFYGVIGTAAAVYSVVSVNLGGFIVGLLLGIFGGALSIAWVPDKRVLADGVDHAEPDEDDTAEIGASVPAYVGEDDEQWRDPESEASEEQEGEQREPFRHPRHAADDEPEPVVPAARTAPDTAASRDTTASPDTTGPATVSGGNTQEVAHADDPNETTAPMSRMRSIPDVPNVRGPAEAAGDDASASEQPTERGDGHATPRALAITVVALTLGALAAFAIHNAAPAAADTCTPTPMQSAIQSAIAKAGVHKPAGTKAKAPAPKTAVATPKHNGEAALAPIVGDQPQPVASIVGGVIGVIGGLGLGSPAGGTAPAAGAALASSDPTPADTPSADPSSPAQTPTATPTPTATSGPTPTSTPDSQATTDPHKAVVAATVKVADDGAEAVDLVKPPALHHDPEGIGPRWRPTPRRRAASHAENAATDDEQPVLRRQRVVADGWGQHRRDAVFDELDDVHPIRAGCAGRRSPMHIQELPAHAHR